MKRVLGLVAIVASLSVASVAVASWNMSGKWVAHVMGAKVVVRVDQKGSAISGVAYVYSPLGKKDTYHFQGQIAGSNVQAVHHSGHMFTGRIEDDGGVSGVLRTKKGHRIPVHASRRQ